MATVVDLTTFWPCLHWSKCWRCSPSDLHHSCMNLETQTEGHVSLKSYVLHQDGSAGCSRKCLDAGCVWCTSSERNIWRRSSMDSSSVHSWVSTSLCHRPHTSCASLPLTGTGAFGFQKCLLTDQDLQLGPPMTACIFPSVAAEHNSFHGSAASMSLWSFRYSSIGTTRSRISASMDVRTWSSAVSSSVPT